MSLTAGKSAKIGCRTGTQQLSHGSAIAKGQNTPNRNKIAFCKASKQRRRYTMPDLHWVMEQIALLAIAFNAHVTPELLRLYAEDLADISREQLVVGFRRARHELKFFPRIAELRELAVGAAADNRDAEAL